MKRCRMFMIRIFLRRDKYRENLYNFSNKSLLLWLFFRIISHMSKTAVDAGICN